MGWRESLDNMKIIAGYLNILPARKRILKSVLSVVSGKNENVLFEYILYSYKYMCFKRVKEVSHKTWEYWDNWRIHITSFRPIIFIFGLVVNRRNNMVVSRKINTQKF